MSPSSHHPVVLVVDDNDAVRDGLMFLLNTYGYRAVGAADGREALAHLEAGLRPCLILLDLRMPRFSGRWFLERKRRDRRFANIAVAVMSATDARRQLQGIVAQLPKPIPVHELLAVVEAHCPPAFDARP